MDVVCVGNHLEITMYPKKYISINNIYIYTATHIGIHIHTRPVGSASPVDPASVGSASKLIARGSTTSSAGHGILASGVTRVLGVDFTSLTDLLPLLPELPDVPEVAAMLWAKAFLCLPARKAASAAWRIL